MNLQKGLVGHWTMDSSDTSGGTIYDKSGHGHHGSISGATVDSDSVIGESLKFTDDSHEVNLSSVPIIPVEKSISFWLRSNRSLDTNDEWQVGFLDDGTGAGSMFGMMFGVGGTQDLGYWGYSTTYDVNIGSQTNKWASDDVWHHISLTMDSNNDVRIYIDGEQATNLVANDGTNYGSVITGLGNTESGFKLNSRNNWSDHTNRISDLRVYDRVLSDKEISALYNMRSQQTKSIESYNFRPRPSDQSSNLMDATSWSVGTTGSQGNFSKNGATDENSIIEESGPYGDIVPIWYARSESTDDGSDGGWNWYNLNAADIDTTKTYRYSVWAKQEYNSGTVYHGTERVSDFNGNYNSNPYYWSGDLPTLNDWYLIVGYNHPAGSSNASEGAIYDTEGNVVNDNVNDFRWDVNSGSDSMRWRTYYYYDTNVGRGARFYDPRLEIMEDNPTPLSAMFNAANDFSGGRDRVWFDGFESGHLGSTWNVSTGNVSSSRQYNGSNSFGQWGGGSAVEATWSPYDGEKKISEFEYYWKEDSSQTGHVVILLDQNGNEVQESGTENYQWMLNNGSGGRFELSGNVSNGGYNNWTRFTFSFDWDNGQYTYDMEDLEAGHRETGTTALDNATGVSEVRFTGSGYGSADYCRFDDITIRK